MDKLPTKPTPILDIRKLYPGWDPIQIISKHKYDIDKVEEVRAYIHAVMSQKMDHKINRIDCYRDSDIDNMIALYDELLFARCIENAQYRTINGNILKWKIVGRMDEDLIGAGGVTTTIRNTGTIYVTLNRKILSKTFEEKTQKVSSYKRCYDRLDCAQQIIEHELIHVMISVYLGYTEQPVNDGHGPIFICI